MEIGDVLTFALAVVEDGAAQHGFGLALFAIAVAFEQGTAAGAGVVGEGAGVGAALGVGPFVVFFDLVPKHHGFAAGGVAFEEVVSLELFGFGGDFFEQGAALGAGDFAGGWTGRSAAGVTGGLPWGLLGEFAGGWVAGGGTAGAVAAATGVGRGGGQIAIAPGRWRNGSRLMGLLAQHLAQFALGLGDRRGKVALIPAGEVALPVFLALGDRI